MLARDPKSKLLAVGGEMLPNQPGSVLAMTGAFVKANPEAAKTVVALHDRATTMLKDEPNRAAKHLQAGLGKGLTDLATFEKAVVSPASKFVADPMVIKDATKVMQDFQLQAGTLEKAADLNVLFDDSFYRARGGTLTPRPSRPRSPNQIMQRTLLAVLGLIAFLLIWEAVPYLGLVSPLFLPPPSGLPQAFLREIQAGYWLKAVLASLEHYVLGLALGTGFGVALGIATALYDKLDAALSWVVRLLRPVPGLAWVPFAIVWFGISETAATFIIIIGVFWINYYAAYGAAKAIDKDLLEVADAFGHRGTLAKLFKIVLPGSTAGILAGVRTGLGQAWMAVVAAELFGVPGLGQRMMQASSLLATEVVVVYMITIAALYGLTDTPFVQLRDRLLRWQR